MGLYGIAIQFWSSATLNSPLSSFGSSVSGRIARVRGKEELRLMARVGQVASTPDSSDRQTLVVRREEKSES